MGKVAVKGPKGVKAQLLRSLKSCLKTLTTRPVVAVGSERRERRTNR